MNWKGFVNYLGLLYYWLSVTKVWVFCFTVLFYSEYLRDNGK
jgi:hypothetical protein